MEKYQILNVEVDNLTYSSIIEYINNTSQLTIISSVNPEIVLSSQNDEVLAKVINNSSLRIADGIGVVWAVKRNYNKVVERITGIDLMEEILKSNLNSKRIFLYGSAPGVSEAAMKNLNEKHNCNIVGYIDGYSDNDTVVAKINESKAQIIFVGLGCPRQEKWIEENKAKLLDVEVLMGVGGSFDVFSGNIKRAPQLIQKLHLEWLYRMVKQPKRIFRQVSLISFVLKVK